MMIEHTQPSAEENKDNSFNQKIPSDNFKSPNSTINRTLANSLLNQTDMSILSTPEIFKDAAQESFLIDQNADPLICKVNAQIRQLAIENENLTQDLFNTQQELKKERKLSLLAKNKAKEALESKIKTEIYLSKLPQASAVHNLNTKLEDAQKDCASLREMVEHWKNEHSKLVKQNSHLQSEKLECEEKINSNHKTIKDLSEKLEKSGEDEKIQLESLKIANGELLSQNQNLKIQKDCFEREFIELTQKSIKIGLEMGNEIEVLENYKNKMDDGYKSLQSSESLLKMKLAKFQNENEAISQKFDSQKNTIENLYLELDAAKNDLTSFKTSNVLQIEILKEFSLICRQIEHIERLADFIESKATTNQTQKNSFEYNCFFKGEDTDISELEIGRISKTENLVKDLERRKLQIKSIKHKLLKHLMRLQCLERI